jgi:hypothetical protein
MIFSVGGAQRATTRKKVELEDANVATSTMSLFVDTRD